MNRVKQLREERGITQSTLGKFLNLRDAAISKYENESVPMTAETIRKLATYFDVSTDYLLGYDTQKNNSKKEENVSVKHPLIFEDKTLQTIFVQRLSKALAQRQMSSAELSLNSDIPLDKCQAYITGNQAPTLEDLSSISDVLHVSTDYLLGKINTKEDGALASFKTLGEDNQDIIVGDMKRYIKEERRAVTVAEETAEKKVVGK